MVCIAAGSAFLVTCIMLYVYVRLKKNALHNRKSVVRWYGSVEGDTAELPDVRNILYQCYGFEVEQDITFVYAEETLQDFES